MSIFFSVPQFLLIALLFLASQEIRLVAGYSGRMLQTQYCTVPMTAGTTIMGRAAVSSTDRTVVVTRNGVALSSGDSYVYGETLVATLSSTAPQYVIEVTGAVVTSGACSQNRVAMSSATFTAPASGSAAVTIVGAWSSGYTVAVAISDTFTLTAPAAPTVSPTTSPTSLAGSTESESHRVKSLSDRSTAAKTGIGAMLFVLIVAIMLYGAYRWAMYRIESPADDRHISLKPVTASRIAAVLSLALCVAAIVLVSHLTKEPTAQDTNLLGKPSWKENLFAWHPVLMVAGFFVSQIGAVASWALLGDHFTAKILHVVCQCAGFATMFAGLWAVWEYKSDVQSYHFATTHAWLGIAAVALFTFTFGFGSLMATLTRFRPESVLRKAFDLKSAHKFLGSWSLTLTTIAVLTGVMDLMPSGTCSPNRAYNADAAALYTTAATSCRVANGLSVVVFIAAGLAALSIAYRGDSFGFTLKAAAKPEPVSAASSSEGEAASDAEAQPVKAKDLVTAGDYASVPASEDDLRGAESVEHDKDISVQVLNSTSVDTINL